MVSGRPLSWWLILAIVSCVPHAMCVTAYSACPNKCTCKQKRPSKLIVDCKRQGFTSIPNLDGLREASIHRIYFDMNRISTVPNDSFVGLNIKGLQLAFNPITDIAQAAFAGLENTLEYLSLKNTQLSTHPIASLRSLSKLKVLDVSDIRTTAFKNIPDDLYRGLAVLEDLDLSNVGLESVSQNGFRGLTSLNVLSLERNWLKKIPVSIRALQRLQDLNMYANHISEVKGDIFANTPQLRIINLSDNRLVNTSAIDSGAFSGLSQLEELNLNFNVLRSIPNHIFGNINNLKKLFLSDNLITSIPAGSFSKLYNLKVLDLSGNTASLTNSSLDGLEQTLRSLTLKRMVLTAVPLNILRKLVQLEKLDLGGNPMQLMKKASFSGVKARHISLMHMGIETIEIGAFDGLRPPLTIELNNNNIQSLAFLQDPCLFHRVELYRNPIRCDCNLYNISKYTSITFIGDCKSPVEYKGMRLGSRTFLDAAKDNCTSTGSDDNVGSLQCEWWTSKASVRRRYSGILIINFVLAVMHYPHLR